MKAAQPTPGEFGIASDVLLWLHENTEPGSDRDQISFVRFLLDEAEDES